MDLGNILQQLQYTFIKRKFAEVVKIVIVETVTSHILLDRCISTISDNELVYLISCACPNDKPFLCELYRHYNDLLS